MGTEPAPLQPGRRASIEPGSSLGPLGPLGSAARAPRVAGPEAGRFEALLEGLAGRAQELDRAARAVQGPAELAGAVETARASLEDALTLREELLAAYRERLQRGDAGAPPA